MSMSGRPQFGESDDARPTRYPDDIAEPDLSRAFHEIVEWTDSFQAELPFGVVGEVEALRSVAQRHAGHMHVSVSIAAELVEVVLRNRFDGLRNSRQLWQRMSTQIATTLVQSPESRSRLSILWLQLCEFAR